MDGFGNTSGFSTTFGASPFREKLTGYEDIYGEQLGQPALNNLKAPEIEAYKNALTDSPDFEPFMQQRKRVLDLATKAVGAGMNIQNPRTEDEVQYALLFNQEVEKYNQLGRRLEEERKGYEQLIDKVGTQGLVVAPSATGRYGLSDVSQSVGQVVSPTQLSTMRRAESFGTQAAADEYTRGSEKIRESLKAQGLNENNPNLRQAMQDYYQIADALIQDGSFDADMAAEMALKQYTARTSRINATKPTSAPPEPPDILSAWQADLTSDDSNAQINAVKFVGLGNLPIIEIVGDEEKTYTPQSVVPLFTDGQPLGVSVLSTDKDLLTKMQQGQAKWDNGTVLYKSNTGEWKASPKFKHKLLTYREAYKQMEEAVAQKKTTYSGEKLGTKGGVGVLGTQPSTETDLSEIFLENK